ncbi:MAG TPA: hypothetical protein VFW40_00960 [Capsulimonadaceae bacterium]|nr:hypothetical protein [Capsulimonadaceae bacterium]
MNYAGRLTRFNLISLLAVAAVLTISMAHAASSSKKSKPKSTQPPGGANQVQGLNGKVGQMLFTGKWRFEVLSAPQQVDTYTMKVPSAEGDYAKYHDEADYDNSTNAFTAKAGYTLIAIDCLAKNGQTQVEQLDFYLNNPNTGLTDDQGQSYQPIAYDMMTKAPWVTKPMLPGSSEKITILFAVPPGTKTRDLVVTLKNWTDSKGKDVRVTLTK